MPHSSNYLDLLLNWPKWSEISKPLNFIHGIWISKFRSRAIRMHLNTRRKDDKYQMGVGPLRACQACCGPIVGLVSGSPSAEVAGFGLALAGGGRICGGRRGFEVRPGSWWSMIVDSGRGMAGFGLADVSGSGAQ